MHLLVEPVTFLGGQKSPQMRERTLVFMIGAPLMLLITTQLRSDECGELRNRLLPLILLGNTDSGKHSFGRTTVGLLTSNPTIPGSPPENPIPPKSLLPNSLPLSEPQFFEVAGTPVLRPPVCGTPFAGKGG
jgi:hypothetical protein